MNKKPNYISDKYNFQTAIGSSIIDELPLWSAPFGLEILNQIDFKEKLNVLDIGFGTGFPLVEISQRLGADSMVYGIDPWEPSHVRTRQKIKFYGLRNVNIIKGVAEKIPLKDKSIDLIVSNNGVNNVTDINKVFSECKRICRKDAQFIISVNLDKTMFEFYDMFNDTLKVFKLTDEIKKVESHIYEKRKPVKYIKKLFSDNSFEIVRVVNNKFTMKFINGTAFFNHSLIKLGFLPSWEKLLKSKDIKRVFIELENRLNKISKAKGHLEMTIPYMVVNARRTK